MSEFKAGDRVKVVKLTKEHQGEGPDPAERWVGRHGEVFFVGDFPFPVGVEFYNGIEMWFAHDDLEPSHDCA